jgi:deoxyhypusine synthase
MLFEFEADQRLWRDAVRDWENYLQSALKRAKAGELMLGGTAEHRAMIAEEFRAAHV